MKQSLPTPRPQPDQPVYGGALLNLFDRAPDRAAYEATYGAQPPAFRPDRALKDWKDDSQAGKDPLSSVSYVSYQLVNGAVQSVSFVMSVDEALNCNLTGKVHYSPYVAAPTQATIGGFPVSPYELSTHDQALQLAADLGLPVSSVVEDTAKAPFEYSYPADEPRRVWSLAWRPGISLTVGQLLKMRNGAATPGAGAPGSWHIPAPTERGEPVWVPAVIDSGETGPVHPHVPMPQRALLLNEEFVTESIGVMFGGVGFAVHRTDMAQPVMGTATGGGLTPSQAQDLAAIKKGVAMLVAAQMPQGN